VFVEAFDKEVKILYNSSEFVPELRFKLDLLRLYERFIEIKYYYSKKILLLKKNIIIQRKYYY
jgi:hypothetical protein